MNRTTRKIETSFGPEICFAVCANAAVPFRPRHETDLERLKANLLDQELQNSADPAWYAPLRHAANEASALAQATPCPLLLFPALFEEKAQTAFGRFARLE